MALTATLHHFGIQLADMDRGVYADFALRVAQQPSETGVFMLVRVLAYCLELEDGIALTEGVAATDEPAVVVRDLTGRIIHWIEVGAPEAERSQSPLGTTPVSARRDSICSDDEQLVE